MTYSNSKSSEKRMEAMENGLNNTEQYTRSWCVRIKGLSIPNYLVEDVGINAACMQFTYDKIFFPVLKHAVKDKVLGALYGFDSVLENGHFIGRGETTRDGRFIPPTIIIRFSNRLHRNTFLRYKRNYMPSPDVVDAGFGVKYYSVTPDLTKINRSILHNLRQDERVQSAWSRDHRLFFSLKINPKVKHFISSIHHSPSQLIQRAMYALQNAPRPPPQNHWIQPQHHNKLGQQLPRHHQQPFNQQQQQPLQGYRSPKPSWRVQKPQSTLAPHAQHALHQPPVHHNRPTAPHPQPHAQPALHQPPVHHNRPTATQPQQQPSTHAQPAMQQTPVHHNRPTAPQPQQQPSTHAQPAMHQTPVHHNRPTASEPQQQPFSRAQPAMHQTSDHLNSPTASIPQQQPFTPVLTRLRKARQNISPSAFKAGARRPQGRRPSTSTPTRNRFAILEEVSINDS